LASCGGSRASQTLTILTPPNLCWIHKEIWESKKIQATYCFPVLPSDMLKDEVKIGNFARDFWGQGEHASFAQILKGSMASMPGHGRVGVVGSGRRISGVIRDGGTMGIRRRRSILSPRFMLRMASTHHHRCQIYLPWGCHSKALIREDHTSNPKLSRGHARI
jgi:hypothetical protein